MIYNPLCTIVLGFKQALCNWDACAFKLINYKLAMLTHGVLDKPMIAATMAGVGWMQAGLTLFLILIGLLSHRIHLRRAGYAGLIAFAASGIVVQIGKFLWDRPRPLLALFNVRIVDTPLFTHSYPSGHSTTAFAVLFACSVYLPKARYILIPLAFATALSRVYLGVHYPLDVTYGGLLGAATGLACAYWVRNLGSDCTSDKEAEASAG